MIVKVGEDSLARIIVGTIIGVAYVIGMIACGSGLIALQVLSALSIVLVPMVIVHAKTYVLDESGCTVKLLWYKKKYEWNEFKYKKYVTYESLTAYRDSVIELSVKRVRKPRRMVPSLYSLLHPLSFIYICFTPSGCTSKIGEKERSLSEQNEGPEYHAIYKYTTDTNELSEKIKLNEKEFKAKLNEWNVKVEDTGIVYIFKL